VRTLSTSTSPCPCAWRYASTCSCVILPTAKLARLEAPGGILRTDTRQRSLVHISMAVSGFPGVPASDLAIRILLVRCSVLLTTPQRRLVVSCSHTRCCGKATVDAHERWHVAHAAVYCLCRVDRSTCGRQLITGNSCRVPVDPHKTGVCLCRVVTTGTAIPWNERQSMMTWRSSGAVRYSIFRP
jgi:hypothetical protein